jgi:hypothetical protein
MMADFDRLDKAVEAMKNTPVPTGPSQDLADRTLELLRKAGQEPDARDAGPYRVGWTRRIRQLWPLAAAAMLMAGFFVGRLTQPRSINSRDLVSLEQSLYNRLHETLASEVQTSQAQTYSRVAGDVNAVLDRRLAAVAAQVLATSNNTTTQFISDLVQIIREQQRQSAQFAADLKEQQQKQSAQFAAALEWLDSARLRDRDQLNTRFASLAVATERGFAQLAGQQGTERPSDETQQIPNPERN